MGVLGNVVGWAWAERKFGPSMLPGLAGGMAISGLLPSLISWVMSPDHKPRFGLVVFYVIAASLSAVGGLCFLLLEFHPALTDRTLLVVNGNTNVAPDDQQPLLQDNTIAVVSTSSNVRLLHTTVPSAAERKAAYQSVYIRMAILTGICSMIFGWQPSLLPYIIPNASLVEFQVAGQVRTMTEG